MQEQEKMSIEHVVDKAISAVSVFEHRHPNTRIDVDVTTIIESSMLKDMIAEINQELAKHNLIILQFFALNPVDYTWHVSEIEPKN